MVRRRVLVTTPSMVRRRKDHGRSVWGAWCLHRTVPYWGRNNSIIPYWGRFVLFLTRLGAALMFNFLFDERAEYHFFSFISLF